MHADDDHSARRDLATSLGHLVIEVGTMEVELFQLAKQLHRLDLRKKNPVDPTEPAVLAALIDAEEQEWAQIEWKRSHEPSSVVASEAAKVGSRVPSVAEAFAEMKASDDHLTWGNFGGPYPVAAPQSVDDLFTRVRGLLDARNALIHSRWVMPSDPARGWRVDRETGTLASISVGLGDIDDLIREAVLLTEIMQSFAFGLGVTRGPRGRGAGD